MTESSRRFPLLIALVIFSYEVCAAIVNVSLNIPLGGTVSGSGWEVTQYYVGGIVLAPIPLAVAVFFTMWRILPLDRARRWLDVVGRSALAAGIGVVLAVIVGFVVGVFLDATIRGTLNVSADFGFNPPELYGEVAGAVGRFVSILPLVTAVTLIGWVVSSRPSGYAAAAVSDEITAED